MSSDANTDDALREAFLAALVLTGSMDAAERAVSSAIATLDPDPTRETLLIESVKLAIHNSDSTKHVTSCAGLPPEIRRLFFLSPVSHRSFVLRILLGLQAVVCSAVMKMSEAEIAVELSIAMIELPCST